MSSKVVKRNDPDHVVGKHHCKLSHTAVGSGEEPHDRCPRGRHSTHARVHKGSEKRARCGIYGRIFLLTETSGD